MHRGPGKLVLKIVCCLQSTFRQPKAAVFPPKPTRSDRLTADWIAGESQVVGFRVEFRPVVLGRQYVVDHTTAEVGGTTAQATPF